MKTILMCSLSLSLSVWCNADNNCKTVINASSYTDSVYTNLVYKYDTPSIIMQPDQSIVYQCVASIKLKIKGKSYSKHGSPFMDQDMETACRSSRDDAIHQLISRYGNTLISYGMNQDCNDKKFNTKDVSTGMIVENHEVLLDPTRPGIFKYTTVFGTIFTPCRFFAEPVTNIDNIPYYSSDNSHLNFGYMGVMCRIDDNNHWKIMDKTYYNNPLNDYDLNLRGDGYFVIGNLIYSRWNNYRRFIQNSDLMDRVLAADKNSYFDRFPMTGMALDDMPANEQAIHDLTWYNTILQNDYCSNADNRAENKCDKKIESSR